jgi:type II secretory pathway predicted ATPase ExeA
MASRGAADGALALIVDEAQSLPHELLEEVRLLSNTEAANGRTLAVALVGQPELAAGLNDPALRQLKQRVALRCELRPLTLEETAACIAERVRIAGGVGYLLFSREAVMAIHERSRGIPRTISVICDNALVSGFAADQKPVGPELIQEVCRDFGIGTEADSQAAGAAAAVQQAPGARVSQPIFGGLTRRWRFSFF